MALNVDEDQLYQGYLAKVYQSAQSAPFYSETQRQAFSQSNVCITYGELLYPSVKKLLSVLQPRSDDIFLDLGSGLGKCAMQMFMQSKMQKVIGIEASSSLNQQAQQVAQQLSQDFPFFWGKARELHFICDNFLNCSWQKATLVYTCSTCFTQELLIKIGDKINQQTQIQKVLSLRPLPTLQLPLKDVFRVECSWDSSLCFFYQAK